MTYRKLFLGFTIGSTLAVAALWVWSCYGLAEVIARKHTAYYDVGLWSGTVMVHLQSDQVRPTKEEADAVPLARHLFWPGRRVHDWYWQWTSSSGLASRLYTYRRTGEFAFTKDFSHFVMGPHTFHYRAAYQLDFPLWVPWLVMVGGAWLVYRWLEKRAGAVMEKKLAEGNTVDRLPGDGA
ncbi:MAG: hypothetical protein EOP88_12525 [Verrucomicrobiaceae bacterium]|nr:MAG: hypothetical protein EOP88_12525 [Verrucomicrobiaceae bacterium]